MKSLTFKTLAVGLLVVAVGGTAARAVDIPLRNWTVPAYRTNGTEAGLSPMVDVTGATSFVGVAPCRLVDTRPGSGFPAGYAGPTLSQGSPRNFNLNSQPNCTGIPSGVEAYSLNITATNTQGPGFILIYPEGETQPNVSTLNYLAGQTIANAAIVPAGGDSVTVIAGVSGTDLIIDINGYFTDALNPGSQFRQIGSIDSSGVIYGQNNSAVTNSSGVFGWAGAGPDTYGVEGRLFANAGAGAAAIRGLANISPNVTYGGKFESSNVTKEAAAVIGDGDTTSGENYGVLGDNDSTTPCAAAVFGRSGSQLPCPLTTNIGVLGTNTNVFAVVGRSSHAMGRGVTGQRPDVGGFQTTGVLGYIGNSGVHSFNDITKAGSVSFVEPHPNDPSRQITYASLEGPEVGTYFRGKARFERGLATIAVPEDFRLVTEPEGLGIQVTPIGDMASVAVVSIDLERIVMKGSRNVEFFYTVNGIRRGYRDFRPLGKNVHFVPMDESDRMLEYMPQVRQKLIANGILTLQGGVNMETAERLGWNLDWKRDQIRIQAEQAADREADRQGVPEGTIQPALTPD